jgi:hypothetical protein
MVLLAPEAVYIDTFGSSRPVAVTMHPGGCDPLELDISCAPPTCGGLGTQYVWNLAAGTYCLTADEDGFGGPGDFVVLNVVRLDAPGTYASPVLDMQDTCFQQDHWSEAAPCGGSTPGGDFGYIFTLCPDEIAEVGATVMDCAPTTREVILSLRFGKANTGFIACDRGPCSASPPVDIMPVDLVGPGIFWFVVDSLGAADCGPMTTSFEYAL